MVVQHDRFAYDVAISFLGDDLRLAEELASLLRDRMSVFLFTERQEDIAGTDGVEKLSSVFSREARLAVILYRPGWGDTPWTRVEATAIKNKGLEQGWDFLLVIPVDATPTVPPWVPRSQIWLSYTHYGLSTAVAVLERKLEELGGAAEPVTAESRAREYARHAEWKAERERQRRSQEGVAAAKASLAELYGELGKAVSQERAADVAFRARPPNAARIWSQSPDGEGTTVTIYWSQQRGNVLDQSGLHVRLWQGFASASGEDLVRSDEPVEIARHEFDFEFVEAGR